MLEEKGFEIHKKNISILSKINALGEYVINLKIHKDLVHPIKVNVTGNIPAKKKIKKKSSDKVDSKKIDTKEPVNENKDSKENKEESKEPKENSKK